MDKYNLRQYHNALAYIYSINGIHKLIYKSETRLTGRSFPERGTSLVPPVSSFGVASWCGIFFVYPEKIPVIDNARVTLFQLILSKRLLTIHTIWWLKALYLNIG